MIKHKEQAELSRATLEIYSSIYSELPLQKRVTDLRNIKFKTKFKVVFHLRSSVIWGCVQLEFFFKFVGSPRLGSIFHLRSSSIEGCLPTEVIFQWRLSSHAGRLPLEVNMHRRLYSLEGCLPLEASSLEVVLHWRLSSIGGQMPFDVVPFCFG